MIGLNVSKLVQVWTYTKNDMKIGKGSNILFDLCERIQKIDFNTKESLGSKKNIKVFIV